MATRGEWKTNVARILATIKALALVWLNRSSGSNARQRAEPRNEAASILTRRVWAPLRDWLRHSRACLCPGVALRYVLLIPRLFACTRPPSRPPVFDQRLVLRKKKKEKKKRKPVLRLLWKSPPSSGIFASKRRNFQRSLLTRDKIRHDGSVWSNLKKKRRRTQAWVFPKCFQSRG